MPKITSKGKKQLTLRIKGSNSRSKRSQRPAPVVKQTAPSRPLAVSRNLESDLFESSGSDSHSSTTPPAAILQSPSPTPSSSTPILSSTLSTTVSKWMSNASNKANDQSTRQILSHLASAVALRSVSQPGLGRDGIKFEDARQEAIRGLKNVEVAQASTSGRKKGKVSVFLSDIFPSCLQKSRPKHLRVQRSR